jgi:UDPglucose 6-dehydrogenase
LINTAQTAGYEPMILSNVEKVNANQKMVLVNKVVDRFGTNLNGRTFGIWGLSCKPGTDDVREATSLTVITSLIDKGAKIKAYDPEAIEEFKRTIDEKYLDSIEFVDNRYSATEGCDGLILITEWKELRNPDFDLLSEKLNEKVIFDGRNIYDKKIKEKGFELYQIGC